MLVQVDGVEEYEVEQIEGEWKVKGKKEFLVEWKGYGDAERTWELLEHSDNARNVLDEWIAQSSNKAPTDWTDADESDKFNCDDKSKESQGESSSIALRREMLHFAWNFCWSCILLFCILLFGVSPLLKGG